MLSFPPLRPLTLSNCLSINPPTPQTVSLCSLSLPSAPLPCPTVYQSTRQHHKLSVCALFPSPPPPYPVQLSINQPANTTNCQSVLSFPPLRPLTLSNCLSINPPTPQTVSLCSLSLPSAPLPCPTVYQSTRQHHKLSVCALFPSPPLPYPVQLSINQPANTTNCQSVLSFPPLRSLTLSNCLSINPPTPQTVSLCSLSLPSAPLPCPTVYQSTRQHHKLSVCALFPSPPPPYPVQLSINQPANTTNCQSVLSFPPLRPLTLSNCLSINPPTPQTVSLCSLSLPSAPLPCPTVYQSTRQHHKLSVCALFPSPPLPYPVQLSINQPANTTNCQSVLSFPPLRSLTLSNCLTASSLAWHSAAFSWTRLAMSSEILSRRNLSFSAASSDSFTFWCRRRISSCK